MDTKSLFEASLRAYYGLIQLIQAAKPRGRPHRKIFPERVLGAVLGSFRAVLGRLGAVLSSWEGHLGQSWPSWGHVGAVFGGLGPSWAILGLFSTVLGRLGAEES